MNCLNIFGVSAMLLRDSFSFIPKGNIRYHLWFRDIIPAATHFVFLLHWNHLKTFKNFLGEVGSVRGTLAEERDKVNCACKSVRVGGLKLKVWGIKESLLTTIKYIYSHERTLRSSTSHILFMRVAGGGGQVFLKASSSFTVLYKLTNLPVLNLHLN